MSLFDSYQPHYIPRFVSYFILKLRNTLVGLRARNAMTAARFAKFSDNAHVSALGLRSVRVLRRHASTTSRRSGEKPRPTCLRLTQFAFNCVQNRAFYGSISGRKASKANYVNSDLWSGRWESNKSE